MTLVEGRLALSDRRDPAGDRTLLAGQRSEASSEGWSAPEPADVTALTSWTTGWLTFRDMPLREAIAEVNRYTAHRLVLADGSHASQRVNGSFRSGDVAAFVEAVTALYALKAEPQADGTTLLKS